MGRTDLATRLPLLWSDVISISISVPVKDSLRLYLMSFVQYRFQPVLFFKSYSC